MHCAVRYWLILVSFALFLSPAVSQEVATPTADIAVPATLDGLPGAGPIHHEEWFQQVWRERRGAWQQREAVDHGALVFLGDSITQGWGDKFYGMFPGIKLANRGISGDTSRGMLIRLEQDVLDLDPQGVVLLLGTNDIGLQTAPKIVAANLKLILAALEEHDPEMPIVLCLVMPSSDEKSRPADQIRELNRLYAEVVHDDPRVTVVDTWTLFADADGNAKLGEFPDLLHPNKVGYAKWAAALRPVFATLDFLETEPDDFTPETGFEMLFNGHDLTGWCYRPTSQADLEARSNWQKNDPNAAEWPIVTEFQSFPGATSTPDGRFVAKHGRLIVTTPPEGRKVQQLWTEREFPNDFVLKLEFRATPNADSGIYLRGPQLQCRDYLLAGPYTELQTYKPQDWNEVVVEVHGKTAHCTCNGEVLEAEFALPSTGPVGVEGDRGQMEYRRIRIKTTPSPKG